MIFSSATEIKKLIDGYFVFIEGEYRTPGNTETEKNVEMDKKIWERNPEAATLTGLALYLGFSDRYEFDSYCQTGTFSSSLKRACLRIESSYEKKLHQNSPTGAIFALKSMGWSEKSGKNEIVESIKTLKIELIETGPQPAENEKDVVL